MIHLNPASIAPIITSITVGALGLVCFKKNHSSRIHQLFFLLCLSVVAWPFALGVLLNQKDPGAVVAWTKAGHLTCTIAPAIYLDFVLTFLAIHRFRFLIPAAYLFAALAVTVMVFTDFYFKPSEVYWYAWGPYAKGNWFSVVDALFGSAIVVFCFYLLARAIKQSRVQLEPNERNRLRYIALALVLFAFALLDYLPKYGIPIPPIGSLFVLAFTVIVTYAIIKHQILDFTIAIRRTAVYSILAALITASYLVVVLITEKWFQGFFGYRSLVATSVVGFAIALGFNPLRDVVQRFVDRWFFTKSAPALAEENEHLRQEVAQSDRMKAVATLAAGMAHEIKNPLSSIKTFAEYLPQKYNDPEYREKFSRIMTQEVDRMNALVQRLLEFAKPGQPQLRRISSSGVIRETLDFLQGTLVKKQIQVKTAFSPVDEVVADAAQIKQALLNVLLNSIEAMEPLDSVLPRSGRILSGVEGERPRTITLSTVQQNGHLDLVVRDTGPGIPKKDLVRIFDPFYTTKTNGAGLGLSVVHSIMKEHDGRVFIESQPGKGTTVRMRLPFRHQTTDNRQQEQTRDMRPET